MNSLLTPRWVFAAYCVECTQMHAHACCWPHTLRNAHRCTQMHAGGRAELDSQKTGKTGKTGKTCYFFYFCCYLLWFIPFQPPKNKFCIVKTIVFKDFYRKTGYFSPHLLLFIRIHWFPIIKILSFHCKNNDCLLFRRCQNEWIITNNNKCNEK